ncbi:helix-turn-helix domain-containing protein [Nocardia sp. NPDC005978]|uniref:TetR/AcrR family transcriptional regulator n=1 Tax=unclassified Nocardia TaxID=2637762 RepID=UPI00339DD9B7
MQRQDLNRRAVLAAAKSEFAERGYRQATVDGIAERAELTRGAVYSNFPGKRALYFAVLAQEAEQSPPPAGGGPGETPAAALAAFAGTWLERLPTASLDRVDGIEQFQSPMLSLDLIPEVLSEETVRRPFAQLIKLDAVLLGAALSALARYPDVPLASYVGMAESTLTILYGATQLSFVAPEIIDPPRLIELCEEVGRLEPGQPPERLGANEFQPPTRVDEAWSLPPSVDRLRGSAVRSINDGFVLVLGMNRIAAIEQLMAAASHEDQVVVVLVSAASAEVLPLARLAIADFSRSLRYAFPARALPAVQIVVDEDAISAGLVEAGTPLDDNVEAAMIIRHGRIIARAAGDRACGRIAASIRKDAPDR